MNKKIYLLRHGATDLQGLYVGSTDVSLSREGREQVIKTGKVLAGEKIEKIFCSPMKRCRETLRLLQFETSYEIDNDLREVDFGRWEKRSFKEINKNDVKLVEDWRLNEKIFCFPDGECIQDFDRRVKVFAKKVLLSSEEKILVVAHGGTIRFLLCVFLGLSPDSQKLFDIQAGCVSTVNLYGEIGALTSLNIKG